MLNLGAMKTIATKSVSRAQLLISKTSPEILIGVGIVGAIGATVFACRATLKLPSIVDLAADEINEIKSHSDVDKKNHGKELTKVYISTAVDVAKLYMPAILIGGASIACLVGSHNIMQRRNAALLAAYKMVDEGFKRYRDTIADEYGFDREKELYIKSREEAVSVEEDGKMVEKKSNKLNGVSQYARFFDETNIEWTKSPEQNLFFLRCQQNYANDQLQARGHIFLNEVYDLLHIPRSQAGALVGWTLQEGEENIVDFGIYDLDNISSRDFVNGYERSILLDFNVDGVIYDLI